MIIWLVLDLGDVVLRRTQALPDLAALLRTTQARLTDAYWGHRREYDLNSDAEAFWTAVAAGSGSAQPAPQLIAELVRIDDLGWSVPDDDTLTLARDAEISGLRLAVLSNAPSSMGRLIAGQPWAQAFHPLVFSGDVGMLKPEPDIYRHLLDVLGAAPGEVAFLDDRDDNVTGALAVGLKAIRFTDAAQARSELRVLGVEL